MWLCDMQAELERERAMRTYVYPRLLKEGKVTPTEASLRVERLSGAIELLSLLRDAGIHQTDQLPLRLTQEVTK